MNKKGYYMTGQSFTGSTTVTYNAPQSGSYTANCTLCGAFMIGMPTYGYGDNVFVNCYLCGKTFISGSIRNVTQYVVGYLQGEFDTKKKLVLNTATP